MITDYPRTFKFVTYDFDLLKEFYSKLNLSKPIEGMYASVLREYGKDLPAERFEMYVDVKSASELNFVDSLIWSKPQFYTLLAEFGKTVTYSGGALPQRCDKYFNQQHINLELA